MATFNRARLSSAPADNSFVGICLQLVLAAAATPPVAASELHQIAPDSQSTSSTLDALLARDTVTGDWWDFRDQLSEVGLTFGAQYIAEYSYVIDGGINEDGSFRNLFTFDVELDLDSAFGIGGGSVFLQYLSVNAERGGTMDSGDIQIYTNIENDRSLDVIYELWYEQVLLDGRLRLKFGKVDANSEFNLVEIAGDFANSSAGFSPTNFAFPSYPDPAMSVNAFATIIDANTHDLVIGYGFYDGAAADDVPTGRRDPSTFFSDEKSDAYFHVWQAELSWDDFDAECQWFNDGRLTVGAWLHTSAFERFDGMMDQDTAGFFITVEQHLFATDGGSTDRGLHGFFQYGWADEDVSEFAQHIAGGLVWSGPLPGRDDDSAGLYASFVDLSDAPEAKFDGDEFMLDTYYRVQVTPAVFIQPELQFIIDPSGRSDIDDALVAGVRVGFSL